jgi:hypothetical protein
VVPCTTEAVKALVLQRLVVSMGTCPLQNANVRSDLMALSPLRGGSIKFVLGKWSIEVYLGTLGRLNEDGGCRGPDTCRGQIAIHTIGLC